MNATELASDLVAHDKQLMIRMSSDLVDKLDAYADELSEAAMGAPISRSAAARAILERFFEDKPKPRKRSRK